MTAGHLLAAPDRIVPHLGPILEEHGISYEIQYTKECDHAERIIDLTSVVCRNEKAQVGLGIEKQRGGKGVDIVLMPECRSFFRRNLDSEKLAEKIAVVLCQHGAREDPDVNCEDLE
ncbi:hypothetical protein [Flavobacterium sp.]|jgi:hypothetical protein|uniref:hypothetical protein n=1 Tax=Flavobacterium sp. TaxID=239 RepID=UPI0037BE98C1